MKTPLTILLLYFLAFNMFGQDSVICLKSWKKPKKIIKLDPTDNYSFSLFKEKADTLNFFCSRSMTGRLIRIDNNILTLKVGYENIFLFNSQGPSKTIEYRYWVDSADNQPNLQTRKVDINKIQSVSFQNYHAFSEVGGVMILLSGLTALFVAPVASINFKTGLFVKERYFNFLKGCGGGIVVGFTIMKLGRLNKVLKIKNSRPDKKDNNYYSIGYK